MKIIDIIGMCFKNLWRRKVRTLLTVLGVVIGSCAIIVMISLGLGSNAALEQSLKQMGELNVIEVYGGGGGGMMVMGSGNSSSEPASLTQDAVDQIEQIEGVSAVFPTLRLDSQYVSLYAGRNNRYAASWIDIWGVYPESLEKFGYELDEGSIPTDGGNFILFGSDAAYQFRDTKKRTNNMVWPETLPDGSIRQPFFNPMTEQIMLNVNNTKKPNDDGTYQSGGRAYEHKLPVAGKFKQDWNKYEGVYGVMIDMGFARQLISDYNRLNGIKDAKEPTFNNLKIWVDDLDDISAVQEQVENMGFNCWSMDTIRQELQGQVAKQQLLLGGLAAISLFVAAIGITNTMIMSIYERTREIGVMKVLGCFISNIRQIFLMEAGCIGFLGGVMGTIISYIISFLLNTFGSTAMGMENMYMGEGVGEISISIIPPWLVLLALAFSTVIGLVSGFYPANRAVKISALEAIKND